MLYVALATASKQLAVMKVLIQWSPSQADKQVPPGSNPLNPTMVAKPVAITSWLQQDTSESVLDPVMAELSHLEMLPSARQTPQSLWSPPLVLAVRSHVPISGASFNQELHSIMDRWEVLTKPQQPLHQAFEQLGSRGGQPPAAQVSSASLVDSDLHTMPTLLQPLVRLRKLEPIVFNKIVVSLHAIQYGKVICIAFSDGTLQYRDRFTMDEIYHEIDVNRIMALPQVGFRYPKSTACTWHALPTPRKPRRDADRVGLRSASGTLTHQLLLCADMRRRQGEVEQPSLPRLGRRIWSPRQYVSWPRNNFFFFQRVLLTPRRGVHCHHRWLDYGHLDRFI